MCKDNSGDQDFSESRGFLHGSHGFLAIEIRASKINEKVEAGGGVLGFIASVSEPISTQAFSQLLSFLAHQYPKIRKMAANQAYLALLVNKILVPEDKFEKVNHIIYVTCWDTDMESTQSQR